MNLQAIIGRRFDHLIALDDSQFEALYEGQ